MDEEDFEDFVFTFNKAMPTGKSQRSTRPSYETSGHTDKRKQSQKAPKSNFRKAHRDLNIAETKDPVEDRHKQDEKMLKELSDIVGDYSQQRMRALHMSLRQYGNDEGRMTSKETLQALQENSVTLPSLLLKSLIAKFDSTKGIDLEALFRFLMESHGRTGRDSVMAMHKRNDLAPRNDVSQDDIDDDLLWRIESQLIKSHEYINLTDLRNELQRRDTAKCGIIDGPQLKHVCNDLQLPIYGALLKNLMKRCDEEKNDKICWPEFLSFLERAQESAKITCPSLKSLPERLKSRTPIEPSPIDELSSKTRINIVNKLRKKSSLKKPNIVKEEDAGVMASGNNAENHEKKMEIKENGINANVPNEEISIEQPKKEETPDKLDQEQTEKDGGQSDVISSQDERSLPSTSGDIEEQSSTNTEETRVQDTPSEQLSDKDNADENLKTADETSDDKTKIGAQYDTDNVEMVTFKNGQIVSVDNKEDDDDENHKVLTEGEKTVVSIEVKGKTLSFTTDKDFIDKQLIEPPCERMRLQWVYGYRGNDCRKNIHTLAGGEILYFMSYVAIIYNKDTHKQKFYKEHTDDIKCIDVHSNKFIVASGQYANRKNTAIKAVVRVWRSDNLHTLHVLGENMFEKSIACLTFAPNKDLIAVVDNSLEKKLTVWDTSNGSLMGQEVLHTDLVCDIGFNPKYPDILVTIGKEHTCWWKVYPESDTIQASLKPDYDNFLRAKFVICLTYNEKGDLITGDSNGTIYVFGDGGNKITNFIKHAHDGPVFTVLYHRGYILSGGRDGIIHTWQWGKNMNSAGFIQMPKMEGGVRMLCVSKSSLLIGTTMNSLLAVKLSEGDAPLQGAQFEDNTITQCHYDELRGLTIASTSLADVYTAGLDGIVCGYNSQDRKPTSKVQFKCNQYLCVDANDNGALLALGTKDGHLQILRRNDKGILEEILNRKICKERIDCIKLSPDSRSIAAGSHDSCVYIFSNLPKEDGSLVWEYAGRLQGNSAPVNGLDWSVEKPADGEYILRTSTVAMELMYWRPATLEVFYRRDVISKSKWMTNSVLVELSIAGIMTSRFLKVADMTSIDVNDTGTLAACGDTSGNIRLYRYPCCLSGTFCHSYRSHASIHGIRFTANGKSVMTVGGRDSCLMQWDIV
ncbi:echinoderm microtubule-associated protein-like 2 isoform X2 [Mercenaria mercenaria]|uniref:echinoderm microtubule-associated protein-like 2 isoform X2 n=1 Tax=Mercenaria mercenaria TaxID=6596 RepID=UPI00234E99FA|nr:echinoderm microtubule-associated protein-like 2 isoform X2 [Mercenaria mercenaria]